VSYLGISDIKIITPEEIVKIDKLKLVDAVEDAYIKFSKKESVNPPRQVFFVNGNWWGVMSASLPGKGVSVKIVNIIPENPQRGLPTINGIVAYLDSETGVPLAVIDAPMLTAYRTAAGSMVSARLLAPLNPRKLSVIGAGFQSTIHMEFFKELYPEIEEVSVYDVSKTRLNRFIVSAGKLFSKVVAAGTPCEAVKDADIVLLATTAREPALNGECLPEEVHVISIGVMGPEYRELDDETVKRASLIAVDSLEAVLSEVGDLSIPLKKGLISKDKIVEIGKLADERKGLQRAGVSGITVFKSVGIAVQDTAISGLLYAGAK
jgi:alanine dehydrogenase